MLLARTLGYKTIQEVLDTMTAAEFALWQAEYSAWPWDEFRIDLAAGVIAATVANANMGKGKAQAPIDYMPLQRRNQEPQGMQQFLTKFET